MAKYLDETGLSFYEESIKTRLNNKLDSTFKKYVDDSLSDKQDTITDLEAIRTGASLGSTALQSYTEQYTGTVKTVNGNKPDSNGNVSIPAELYESLPDKPSINNVTLSGNKTLDDLSIQGKLTQGNNIIISGNTISASKTTESEITGMGFTKNTGTVTSVNGNSPVNGNVTIAIPNEVTETTVSGWGFTKNTGTYSKPSGGIPNSDLANGSNFAVKNSNNNFSSSQTITGDLTVTGNITQSGSSYETHAEKVYTKNDYIMLRDGATGGLASNNYTGIEAAKYDGTNNGRLAFDNAGTARVGDVGSEQPLLTRDESSAMTNGKFIKWDSANLKGKTSDINISDVTNLQTELNKSLVLTPTQTSYNANECYDGKVWLIQNGSNCPVTESDGKQYGSVFTLPYRKATGNTIPDYAGQIYIPNGGTSAGVKMNSMFFRTSQKNSWNPWQEVTRGGYEIVTLTQSEYDSLTTKKDDCLYFIKG